MKSNHLIFIEEFSKQIENHYYEDFKDIATALQLSGTLIKATKGWLQQKIGEKVIEDDSVKQLAKDENNRWWKTKLEKIAKSPEEEKKRKQEEFLKTINLSEFHLHEMITINAKCKLWSENMWRDYVPQMFLEKKDYYDEAKFKIVRIPITEGKKVNELYHRIKADENTFEEVALKYGNGDERLKGGCIRKIRFNNHQRSLVNHLKNRRPGELISPFKLNEWYIIIEVIDIRAAELNEQVASELITEAFNSFLTYSTNYLTNDFSLKFKSKS